MTLPRWLMLVLCIVILGGGIFGNWVAVIIRERKADRREKRRREWLE